MIFGVYLVGIPALAALALHDNEAGAPYSVGVIECLLALIAFSSHYAVALLLAAECEVHGKRLDDLIEGVMSLQLRSPNHVALDFALLQTKVLDTDRFWRCWNFVGVSLDASVAVLGAVMSIAWLTFDRDRVSMHDLNILGIPCLVVGTFFIIIQTLPLPCGTIRSCPLSPASGLMTPMQWVCSLLPT